MQTNNFISYLSNSKSISTLKQDSIDKLTNQFPFCQTGQILSVICLNNNNSLLFDQQLKKAAIYSSDRKRLFTHLHPEQPSKDLIENQSDDITDSVNNNIEANSSSTANPQETTKEVEITTKEIDSLEKNYISEAVSSTFILEADVAIDKESVEKEINTTQEKQEPVFNENEAHSFSDWLLYLKEKDTYNNDEKDLPKKKIDFDIIDKFIQEDPQIKPKKSEFYSPINMARLSVTDDSDMVSETLALIYVDQGNYNNAISTYEKLSLKNPEKRSYFANQIQILKQKIK